MKKSSWRDSGASRFGLDSLMNESEHDFLKSKALLRKKICLIKISEARRQSRSKAIGVKIQKTDFFKNSGAIGFYAALPDEVDILSAAKKALAARKKVFFPRLVKNKIEFFEVHNLKTELRRGKFGILEPAERSSRKRKVPLDLILVPGRAFDKKGHRLGRGGGYYDRLLEKWDDSVRFGIAFREQLVRRVPSEPHDIVMDIVITG